MRAFIAKETTETFVNTFVVDVLVYADSEEAVPDVWFRGLFGRPWTPDDDAGNPEGSEEEGVWDNTEQKVYLDSVRPVPAEDARVLEKYLATYPAPRRKPAKRKARL